MPNELVEASEVAWSKTQTATNGMARHKPIVLTWLATYLPGYKAGGPVRTIAHMADHLRDDVEFHIITADRDLLDRQPYPNVSVDHWNTVGNARVYYASLNNRSCGSFARLVTQTPHDMVYLNSFFQPVFTLRPLIARRFGLIPNRPMIIAPRGEFSEGALALKRWKKAPYRAMVAALGLCWDVTWQASSEYEADDIRKAMGSTARRIEIAPNLPPALTLPVDGAAQKTRKKSEALHVCFLSRISPKKNLDFALRVLAKVQTPVIFDIYGPIEDSGYWKKCEGLIQQIGHPVSVHYKGSIEHSSVSEVFRNYDLFFFPTRGENFGHVILESLLAGTPVLLSDTTPWRDLDTGGVGWDLSLSAPDAFVAAILKAASMDGTEYSAWRDHVRRYAIQKCNNLDLLEANKHLFLRSLDCDSSVITSVKS